MKKMLIPALSVVLLSASVATMAHMPGGHPGGTSPGGISPFGMSPGAGPQATLSPEVQALQQEMHAKLAAAQTPEEREALMKEQHEKMRDKMPEMARAAGMPQVAMGQRGNMPGMMGMHGMGGMNGMPPMNRRHHPMMQEQRPQNGG